MLEGKDYYICEDLSELAISEKTDQLPALNVICERGDISKFSIDKQIYKLT